MPGKGGGVVDRFDQPVQHRIGVDLKHAGNGPNAQPFSQ
jgi:hypothetical protein